MLKIEGKGGETLARCCGCVIRMEAKNMSRKRRVNITALSQFNFSQERLFQIAKLINGQIF